MMPAALTSKTIVSLMESAFKRNPESLAVIHGDESITYRELDDRTSKIANWLRLAGIEQEARVPVLIAPGVNLIVTILAIMRAGGAYVPLDREYPLDRIKYIIEDTKARIVITCEKLQLQIPDVVGVSTIQKLLSHTADVPISTFPILPVAGRDLAYVIYTSGSTGKPKGVMVEHQQLYTYIIDIRNEFRLDECASFAILGSLAADAGHTAFFNAICFGNTLSIFDIKQVSGFNSLVEQFNKHPVDCYKITPSLLQLFLKDPDVVHVLPKKKLILGGEPLSWFLANTVFRSLPNGCQLYNHYGPTETTVGVLTYTFPTSPELFPAKISLGKPLSNVNCYILDEEMEDSITKEGELFIEGPFVARGYLNNEILTTTRFVWRQTSKGLTRLYRTGDLVRVLPDGNIEYIGRTDDQVKINGYRIEVKEIEHAILETTTVKECIVMPVPHADSSRLVGYVLPEIEFSQQVLVDRLQRVLPGYMIPAKWVTMTKWPLTFNNKIDKKKLPNPYVAEPAIKSYDDGLEDEVTRELQSVWRTVLDCNDILPTDNFFEKGGDSMKVIELSFKVATRFNIELSAVEIYRFATIVDQRELIHDKRTRVLNNEKPLFDPTLASISQRNLYIQYKLNPSLAFPHANLTFEIQGFVSNDKLEHCFNVILKDNENLHTVFNLSKGRLVKETRIASKFIITTTFAKTDDLDFEINALTISFNLEKLPLIRAHVIHLKNGRVFFYIDMHHINSDGETLKLFMQELEARYNESFCQKKRFQFTDFQRIMHDYMYSIQFNTDKDFWTKEFMDDIKLPDFGFQKKSYRKKFDGVCVVRRIDNNVSEQLDNYLRINGLTRFQFLLSLFALSACIHTDTPSASILVPLHNRNNKNTDEILGLLSNVVLLRLGINQKQTIGSYLKASRDKIFSVFYHQQFPFENQVEIWKSMHGDVGKIFNFFFGYHSCRENYTFGDASLEFHVPKRDKENLPLSLAFFETGNSLTLRVTSNLFDSDELNSFVEFYFSLIVDVLKTNGTESVDGLLESHPRLLSKSQIYNL